MSERAGRGALVAVGTGIRVVGQLTTEAIAWISRADRVFTLVGDPVAEETIRGLNAGGCVESLTTSYDERRPRADAYREMAERLLASVRAGALTCVASYGHPGVFADPIHEAIRRARAEGFPARILPAISAEDCLFADLGVDPASFGCQSYDATDFLVHDRRPDATSAVILWQIGVVGDPRFRRGGYDLSMLSALVERLLRTYPPHHVCYVYEAAVGFGEEPRIQPVSVGGLGSAALSASSTLYVPPSRPPTPDPAIVARIGALM